MIDSIADFLRNIYRHRTVITVMARREFATRYIGTFGGFIWSILNPLATVAVFWLVFSVAYKARGPSDTPFVLYFLCGLIPWLTFSEVLTNSISAVSSNPHFVKKIAFPTEILPIIHMIASTIAHVVLLAILLVFLVASNRDITYHVVTVLYYYTAMCVLILGLSWALSALNVFSRDVAQVVTVALNLWFWLTPIAWFGHFLPDEYTWVVAANPMYYVVDGYRNAFLFPGPLFHNAVGHLYFWAIALGCVWTGSYIFHRLKPEFPDVL